MTFENILDENANKTFTDCEGRDWSSWMLESKIRACCYNFLQEEAILEELGEIVMTDIKGRRVPTGFSIKGKV